jgi:hypothetical protein
VQAQRVVDNDCEQAKKSGEERVLEKREEIVAAV